MEIKTLLRVSRDFILGVLSELCQSIRVWSCYLKRLRWLSLRLGGDQQAPAKFPLAFTHHPCGLLSLPMTRLAIAQLSCRVHFRVLNPSNSCQGLRPSYKMSPASFPSINWMKGGEIPGKSSVFIMSNMCIFYEPDKLETILVCALRSLHTFVNSSRVEQLKNQ